MIDITQPNWLADAMKVADIQTGELSALSGVSRSQIQRLLNGMEPRLGTAVALKTAIEQRAAPVDQADAA